MTFPTTFKAEPQNILVVDDTLDSLKMLTTSLTGQGYTVRPANSGQLALATVAEQLPDLILLDVKMPEMDGFEVCRRLKANKRFHHIPVIFISALDEALDKVKAFEVGGIDYITKPFQIEEVLVRVKTQLSLKRMQRALEHSHNQLEARVRRRTMELEAANKKLIKSEERFRSLYDKAPLSYQALDSEGNFLEVNETWLQLLGYTRKEVIGHHFSEFLHPDGKNNFSECFSSFKAAGEVLGVEFDMVKKDGGRVLVSFHGKISTNEKGDFKQSHCIFRDITEQRKFHQEKESLEAQLRQSQKMESIGTLAGGIAHDFNNILTSILGYAQLSLDSIEKDSDVESYLQKVYAAGYRAKDLVQQILTFARQSNEEIIPLRVDTTAREVIKFIRASIPTTIEIQQYIKSKSLTLGSATQIHQILMNLCTNAAQAMEQSGGILKIEVEDEALDNDAAGFLKSGLKPGDYIRIKISDTGVGIEPDILESIFEPYFTTKPPGEGTGLGLAVVHGIVESYNGQITVDSIIGKGTVFTIYLPVTEKPLMPSFQDEEDLPKGTEHILFVDDEVPIAEVGALMLERLGYTVTVCFDSLEALALFRSKTNVFDLVISDMTMPNMTGDKLAIELMKIRPDIPVILCTGYSNIISEEAAKEIDIKAFALKPMVQAELARTVRKVIDERQQPPA